MKPYSILGAAAVLTIAFCHSTIAQIYTLDVRAYTDGRDQLMIAGDTLQWHHLDYAAVGRHNGLNEPTTISTTLNGAPILSQFEWIPDWPAPPPDEIRYEAFSSVFSDLDPALPAGPMSVTLDVIAARWSLQIAQLPTAANNFTTILDFDDDPLGGPDYYEGLLTFTVVPEPFSVYLLGAGLCLFEISRKTDWWRRAPHRRLPPGRPRSSAAVRCRPGAPHSKWGH